MTVTAENLRNLAKEARIAKEQAIKESTRAFVEDVVYPKLVEAAASGKSICIFTAKDTNEISIQYIIKLLENEDFYVGTNSYWDGLHITVGW